MFNSDYKTQSQLENLRFFATVVASNLGIRRCAPDRAKTWPSFMTDDGTPIELSWDWGTGNCSPVVRYSIEPVGLGAGTTQDPHNQCAARSFHELLLSSLPGTRLEWYGHFTQHLEGPFSGSGLRDDRLSHIFYAFDLVGSEVTSKAYFFPGHKARSSNRTNLDVIREAILAAPFCSADRLAAFYVFCDWASQPGNATLELGMLAIDLLDPFESRLKIYYRLRETSRESLSAALTLGGRIRTPELDRGLQDLEHLWALLFGFDREPHTPFDHVDHRTAGILYNVEFKLGSKLPITKVYLPVHHYGRNDAHIMRALLTYLRKRQRDAYASQYVQTMHSLL
ncbi:MAG: hypothetical protein M1833_000611 [Piccolia ochrophora]|nr:MAG: hypothetical protein M1833_000611 [Piccolia ochrophora]